VRLEVGEGLRGQAEGFAQRVRRLAGDRDAGALEDVDHAEEAHRIVARDAVVDVAHHQLGRQRGPAAAHRLGVGPAGGDVVEDPFLVAVLLVDVFGDRLAQPFEAVGQARAAGHQQRHGMPDVMIGLAEEGEVGVEADATLGGAAQYGGVEQVLAFGGGVELELVVEVSAWGWSWQAVGGGDSARAWRERATSASRRSWPLVVARRLAAVKASSARSQRWARA